MARRTWGRLRRHATGRNALRAGRLGTLGLAAIALSGCLSSGYQFISHRNPDNTMTYFKLPQQWKVTDYSDIAKAANGPLTRSQVQEITQAQGIAWLHAFSANPKFKPTDAAPFGQRYPEGLAYAQQLTPNSQSSFSLATMRSVVLGQDPLDSASPDNVLSYSQTATNTGLRQTKLVVDVPQRNGSTATFGQVTIVDPQTNWVFVLAVGCKASCWAPNQGLIKQVLNSWTVKER